jgi:hypothetical protein
MRNFMGGQYAKQAREHTFGDAYIVPIGGATAV